MRRTPAASGGIGPAQFIGGARAWHLFSGSCRVGKGRLCKTLCCGLLRLWHIYSPTPTTSSNRGSGIGDSHNQAAQRLPRQY
ncbi:hypothetical protein CASFOL_033022 [Castilleja foliolosa]|uniref:Uncharacterized protein n=1 Tax=Castilleja foliolosa TaxID=1961234 RepID=A0ABD3C4Y8_9LAMI